MEKLTKKDLKGPDAFQSNMSRFTEYSFKHRVPILSFIGLLVLGGLSWAGWGMYAASKEERAQNGLYAAEQKLKAIDDSFEPASPPARPTDKAPPPTPAKVPTGQMETDYKEPVALLKSVIKDFPNTQTAVLAGLDLARLNHSYKKYEDEIGVLESLASVARHPVSRGLALNYLGLAYEAKGDCHKAIENWQNIENDKKLAFLQGNSFIKIGLCYERLNQPDKAEQSYRKAEALTSDPEASRTAKKYLRLLKRSST